MLLRRFLLVMAALFFAALIFLSGYAAYPLLHQGAPPLTAADAAAAQAGDMGQFWQVWSLLDRDFYGAQPDALARTRGAIAGMVQTFGDPYTFWVEPQTRELERDDLAGRFGGIGATVEQTADAFVLHPLADQPAAPRRRPGRRPVDRRGWAAGHAHDGCERRGGADPRAGGHVGDDRRQPR